MSREIEIKQVAAKLLQGGIAKSHMDAMRMAESMVTTDMTPSKKKIDNLTYETAPETKPIEDKETVSHETVEIPQQATENSPSQYNIGADIDASTPISELTREIRDEIEATLKEKNTISSDMTRPPEEAISKEEIKHELEAIENEDISEIDLKKEAQDEEELKEPELLAREEEIIAHEENPVEIKESLTEVIESEDENPRVEKEMEEELKEQELLKEEEEIAEQEYSEIKKKIQETNDLEKEMDVDIEIVDLDSDDEDITHMF